METTRQQIQQNLGATVEAVASLEGYVRWLYIGALQDGSKIIDHSNVTDNEEATATYRNLPGKLSVSNDDYCIANNEFMCQRRCAMGKFLRMARAQQTKLNSTSSGGVHDTH